MFEVRKADTRNPDHQTPHGRAWRRAALAAVLPALLLQATAAPARDLTTTLSVSRTHRYPILRQEPVQTLEEALAQACHEHASRIGSDFGRDPQRHLISIAAALRLLGMHPLAVLGGCQDAFEDAVRGGDIDAYWSIVIELARRLSRSPSAETEARLESLQGLVFERAAPRSFDGAQPGALLLAMDGSGYRGYSLNAGLVAGILSVTRFGREMYASGAQPEHVLRFVNLHGECAETAARLEPRQVTIGRFTRVVRPAGEQAPTCIELLDRIDGALAEALENSGGGAMRFDGRDLSASLAEGLSRTPGACLATADDPLSRWVAAIEATVACEQERLEQWQEGVSFDPYGTAFSGGDDAYAPHRWADEDGEPHEVAEQLTEGFSLVPSEGNGQTAFEDGTVQTTWEYQNDEDPNHTITVTELSERVENEDGELEWQSRTIVTEEIGFESATTQYDEDGNRVTHESTIGDVEVQQDYHPNGAPRASVYSYPDGSFMIINQDENGTITNVDSGQCDAEGCRCTQGCESEAASPRVIDNGDGNDSGSAQHSNEGEGGVLCIHGDPQPVDGCREPTAEQCRANPHIWGCDRRDPGNTYDPDGRPVDPSDLRDECRKDPQEDLTTALGDATNGVEPGEIWIDPRWTDPREAGSDPELAEGSVFAACVNELLAIGQQDVCGPSALQCIDPYSMTDACDCGLQTGYAELPSALPETETGICRYIQCEAGTVCNAATGLCENPEQGEVAPGVIQPDPVAPSIESVTEWVDPWTFGR